MTEISTGNSRPHRDKMLFLLFGGAIGIILLVLGAYQLVEFTDSTAFCGRLCHSVMYPEYTAFQASPHSRVLCSGCHVGSGVSYLVKSKLSGIPQIIATITNTHERPISTPVKNLRPARETCEQCHRPEKFAGDVVRVHTTYTADKANTIKVDTRVMRVGGGESSSARDIHWHIAAKVWYLTTDEKRQEIGWVGVENNNNQLTEYIDPKSPAEITSKRIQEGKRLMDCMDCHNRATHIFQSPDKLIDSALVQGKLDASLPYIKWLGLQVLDPPNPSLSQAFDRVETIREFYRNSFPQVFKEKEQSIDVAIKELKEVARLTTFPDMKVTWKTYPDNIGHMQSPGCLRCHGKLVGTSGEQKGKSIDASCDSCHYFRLGTQNQTP